MPFDKNKISKIINNIDLSIEMLNDKIDFKKIEILKDFKKRLINFKEQKTTFLTDKSSYFFTNNYLRSFLTNFIFNSIVNKRLPNNLKKNQLYVDIYHYCYKKLIIEQNYTFLDWVKEIIINNYSEKKWNILNDISGEETQKIISEYLFLYKEYEQNMKQKLDELKLPNNLKNKKIKYKNLKQKELPSLQQLCSDKIKKRTNIICFPCLELDKKLKKIGFEIDVEKINSLNLQNQTSTSNYKSFSPKM